MHRRLLTAAATLVAAALPSLVPAVAGAAETSTTIKGWTGAAGPARWDRLAVTKFGPASAGTVLVLVPGTSGGRGDFTPTAREVVARVPGLAVWAVDRRSQALEDTQVFADALAGKVSLQGMLDYYLNWLSRPAEIPDHFQPPDERKLAFMKRWGLEVQLRDVRAVVQSARRAGKRVLLGGH